MYMLCMKCFYIVPMLTTIRTEPPPYVLSAHQQSTLYVGSADHHQQGGHTHTGSLCNCFTVRLCVCAYCMLYYVLYGCGYRHAIFFFFCGYIIKHIARRNSFSPHSSGTVISSHGPICRQHHDYRSRPPPTLIITTEHIRRSTTFLFLVT
jgi:hypothetical protein